MIELDQNKISEWQALFDCFIGQLTLTVHEHDSSLRLKSLLEEDFDQSIRERSWVVLTKCFVEQIIFAKHQVV
jgi:hypothetical protein